MISRLVHALLRLVVLPLVLAGTATAAEPLTIFGLTTAQTAAPYEVAFAGDPEGYQTVRFTAPDSEDDLDGEYISQAVLIQSPTRLAAPSRPGRYDLALEVDNDIVARLQVTVTPATASLSGPDIVVPGAYFSADWTGPGGVFDRLAIAATGAAPDSELAGGIVGAGGPALLRAPLQAGTYELRYLQQVLGRPLLLATAPLLVGHGRGTDGAPIAAPVQIYGLTSVMTGGPYEVTFDGNGAIHETVRFAMPGTTERLPGEPQTSSPLLTSPTVITAPAQPGRYDLVHMTGGTVSGVLAVDVATALATLDAPDLAAPGKWIDIAWSGPNGPFDTIWISRPDAPVDAYEPGTYAIMGPSPIATTAPAEPGLYEIRYIQAVGTDRTVLARRPLMVR